MKTTKAFTLIELLVVISIIGLLSSVVLASLNTARAKARDARRKQDLKQIQLAMELFRDKYGTYYLSGSGSSGVSTGWFSYDYDGSAPTYVSAAQKLVNEGFIGGAVIDPSGQTVNNGGRSGYMFVSNANQYTLWANLENPTANDTATLSNCVLSNWDGYPPTAPQNQQMNYCVSSN